MDPGNIEKKKMQIQSETNQTLEMQIRQLKRQLPIFIYLKHTNFACTYFREFLEFWLKKFLVRKITYKQDFLLRAIRENNCTPNMLKIDILRKQIHQKLYTKNVG